LTTWCTYVACGIVSDERECVTNQSHAEGNSIVRPRVSVGSRREHKLGVCPRPKIYQWYQDCKKANDMPNKEETFKLGQPFREAHVDNHTKHDDAPIYQCTMPRLVLLEITRVIECCQRLDHGSSKICRGCSRELPSPERDPSEDPTDDPIVLLRCQFGRPAILCRGGRRHGCIFGERSAGAESSDETEKEPIDQGDLREPIWSAKRGTLPSLVAFYTYRTSVGKDRCECHRVCFPC